MNKIKIEEIKVRMAAVLLPQQMQFLDSVLKEVLDENRVDENRDFIQLFIFAKKAEGKSDRTESYYSQVLRKFEENIDDVRFATTNDIRNYLYQYQCEHNCSALTVDNIRRILSSFYVWMENEDYILKSPMKRIAKVKIPKTVKTVYTDEEVIIMRDSFQEDNRNLAMFDLLSSSGLRVGELVSLNRKDINIDTQTAVVYGKGAKERYIYFDTKTKLSLKKYLEARDDNDPALFVTKRNYSKDKLKHRLTINQVEYIIRQCGVNNQSISAYPHKFRRTFATKAIDKGMPIEQVQVLLGHTKIDTTLRYAQVQQRNVQYSYHKYIV